MKVFEIPMVVTSLLGFCFLPDPHVPAAHADFYFGEPENLGPVINSSSYELGATTSMDDLELYFTATAGGYGAWDVWVSTRQNVNDPWGLPSNLGPTVNSLYDEGFPKLSWDGLALYFSDVYPGTPRPGGLGGADIWMSIRASRSASWGTPVNAGAPINSSANESGPSLSRSGLTFVFASDRAGGYGDFDLWISTRPTVQDPWGAPVNLGPNVNSSSGDFASVLSADGLALFFLSDRAGGFGGYDVWMTTRRSTTAPWSPAVNLGPVVNNAGTEGPGGFSGDMTTLYLTSDRPGSFGVFDVWTVPILPVVDFNGDGKVDAADMALLGDNWGLNESLCDIGPFAWGDGIVDEKDLSVLMKLLMTPGPQTSDVLCDTILSWVGPGFADSYDVYLGSSFDDVSNATRNDPCGVLVSEGQTETTYDPEGLLEFSQTYYWRVDLVEVVLGSLDPVIYRGPVLSFTTEAYAYPIQSIIATASSSGAGTGPEKTVDGSGLDENDGHSTDGKDMWQSKSKPPQWIQFEFDQVYALHELWVWNSNSEFESFMSFGSKDVAIEYSADGTTWTTLDGVPEFAKAPGTPSYKANTVVSFAGVSAKYVKLTIEKGWSVAPAVGLSEVRFFYIPDRSWVATP
ncbi:MAG: discoidin domain-containing protein [Phycisphaerales bacterium]